jgi:SAM-dependent methyltransferase
MSSGGQFSNAEYLMESAAEADRLDRKTDIQAVKRQALLGGLQEGSVIADLGCGSGKTTTALLDAAGQGAVAMGVELDSTRVAYAIENYSRERCAFRQADIRCSLFSLGFFDFVWIRFVLEYYLQEARALVQNASEIVKSGGRLCLVDLDNNCLNHFPMPERLEKTLDNLIQSLQIKANFDPYAGRKLYSYLYDLGYRDITVNVEGHHVIYGRLRDSDEFNWMKKIEIAPQKIGYKFKEYAGGYDEFRSEFEQFFGDPRRFTYSPLIICSGIKP